MELTPEELKLLIHCVKATISIKRGVAEDECFPRSAARAASEIPQLTALLNKLKGTK